MTNGDDQTTGGPGLPFDPITIVIGLLRRWKIFVAIVLVSGILGVGAALQYGTRIYEAETLLLYKGSGSKDAKDEGRGLSLPLKTQIQMVKIPSNLEAVREKLKLATTLKSLGKACKVDVERKTSLVTIEARWTSPKVAVEIVRNLRDVFLANQVRLAKRNAHKQLKDVQARFGKIEEESEKAKEKLESFISKNKIVDVGKEVQWNLEQLTSLELLYSNTRNEKDTIEAQKQNLEQRIELLKKNVAQEEEAASESQSLADLNIRIERLRRAIHDDKEQRTNEVELGKYHTEYERAKELFAKGLISQEDFEKVKADYESQEVKTIDTKQISEWKSQLKALESEVIPSKTDKATPGSELLQSLEVKILDMDLKDLSLKKKVGYLNEEKHRIKARLEKLTEQQRQYTTLSRDVAEWEARRNAMEQVIEEIRGHYESDDSGFVIVSDAQMPLFSSKSNRKIILAIVVFLGGMIGFTLILAMELLDRTIKSGAELQHKFSTPVVGLIPSVSPPEDIFPTASNFPLIELFRIVSRRVRRECPSQGARIMITSACHAEGKTLVTANLAACLSRLDEQVLVMDAELRSYGGDRDLRYIIERENGPYKGLGDWLASGEENFDEILHPTVFPRVQCIPRAENAVSPDLLGSNRMGGLMNDLSQRFSLILVDGPSVSDRVDAELAAQWCDAVVCVVRSRACGSAALKRAFESIRSTDVPLVGFILNDVDPIYLKWA